MTARNKILMFLGAVSLLSATHPGIALALGTETFGNKTLNEQCYQEWPNLSSIINDTNRVYQYWVNGGEGFFFRGNTKALNEALQQFALVQAPVHEVVLLPGPANISCLLRDKTFAYDWRLEINSGISKMLTRGKGGLIWNKDPVLTVFIGEGNVVLNKIYIPKGITVLEISDLRKRYTEAIKQSEDINVRGWGACRLARLDPFDSASVATVTGLLEDTNEWVRLNAVIALEAFGTNAASAVPSLKRIVETSNKDLKQRAEKVIATIEAGGNKSAADNLRSVTLERISLFRKSLSQPGDQ